MATNEEFLAARNNVEQLKIRERSLLAALRQTQQHLNEVQSKLELARHVGRDLDGVAISVSEDTVGQWVDMHTLATGEGVSKREVHMYKAVNGDYWLVRVNESSMLWTRFQGGRAIGFGHSWTREQATAIAERWLKGDDTILH